MNGTLQLGRELITPSFHHFRHPVEDLAAVIGGSSGPARLRLARRLNGIAKILAGCTAQIGQRFLFFIQHLEKVLRFGSGKLSADIEFAGFQNVQSIAHCDISR